MIKAEVNNPTWGFKLSTLKFGADRLNGLYNHSVWRLITSHIFCDESKGHPFNDWWLRNGSWSFGPLSMIRNVFSSYSIILGEIEWVEVWNF